MMKRDPLFLSAEELHEVQQLNDEHTAIQCSYRTALKAVNDDFIDRHMAHDDKRQKVYARLSTKYNLGLEDFGIDSVTGRVVFENEEEQRPH